ncbi:FecR domain-containing protein [Pantoea sp. 18069]|uniref:FecR domain-containing protein n=1 Tax=Pantoea sp. 18069 TaxID=2681415 RepID=UPI001F32908B|nr:FecR domain-containing protein [Pantoea sp. 18069]
MPPVVAQQAVDWWLQLMGADASAAQRAAWQAWCAADPLHAQAWERIQQVNQQLSGWVAPQQAGLARATLAPTRARRAARRRVVQALALLVFGGGAAWQLEQSAPWQRLRADARTPRGVRRRMVLQDGTQLVLNGGSALNVDYSPQQRRLRLLEGEMLITTAADARAFVVETAAGEAQALGTRFVVRAGDDGSTRVGVFDGAVRLRPRQSPGDAQVLQAGQQAVFGVQRVSVLTPVHEDSAAWTDGILIARGMPLAEMLQALQPYSTATLVCAPEVAGLRMSGSYPLDDMGRVLATLHSLPELQVRRLTRWWGREEVLLEPAAHATR